MNSWKKVVDTYNYYTYNEKEDLTSDDVSDKHDETNGSYCHININKNDNDELSCDNSPQKNEENNTEQSPTKNKLNEENNIEQSPINNLFIDDDDGGSIDNKNIASPVENNKNKKNVTFENNILDLDVEYGDIEEINIINKKSTKIMILTSVAVIALFGLIKHKK